MTFRGLARTYKCTVRIVPYYSSIYFAKARAIVKYVIRFYLFRAKLLAFIKYFACRNCIQPVLFTKKHGVDAGAYSIFHV